MHGRFEVGGEVGRADLGDPHEHGRARRMVGLEQVTHHAASHGGLAAGYGAFEIEDDRVGADGERLVHAVLAIGGNEEHASYG